MPRLLLVVLSLWVVWAIRAHDILAMPAFVDESLHIMRAQAVYQFTDEKSSFLLAKLLLYYYFGLFDPQDHNALWLTRQALALIAPLSAALSYAIVYHLTRSYWKSLITVWLHGLTPLLIFFERMAMSDPFVMMFGLAVVWAGMHFAEKPNARHAAILGFLLGLTLLAKLTAVPLLVVPILALYFLGRYPLNVTRGFIPLLKSARFILAIHFKNLVICYSVMGLILLPFVGYMLYREINPPEEKPEVVDSWLFTPTERNRIEQIGYNVERYTESLIQLNALILLLFGMVLVVGLLNRRNMAQKAYLLLTLAATWGFIGVVAAFPSTRYLVLGFPILLIFSTTFFPDVNQANNGIGLIALPLLSCAALTMSAAFIFAIWNDPAHLTLGEQDNWEYRTHTSSGYGLREAVPDILALPEIEGKIRLTGFVGNCHSLRLYFPENHQVDLHCPYFKFNDSMIPDIMTRWEQQVNDSGRWYFLVEDADIIDFEAMALAPELIATYDRPHEGVRVWLYRVTPGEGDGWFK